VYILMMGLPVLIITEYLTTTKVTNAIYEMG